MFETLALLGGFWFFLFVVVVLAAGILCAEFDSFFGAAATLIVGLISLDILFGYAVWQSIVANPFVVVLYLAAYTAIGLAYGIFFRYADFLKKKKESVKRAWGDYQLEYRKTNGADSTPTREGFRESYKYKEFTPSYNSDRIAAWVMLWPWAVFWDLCHKPFRFIYDNLYTFAGRMLDAVGARVSNKILDEK